MTHFETSNGLFLGSTFAGDNGLTFFLTEEEAMLLFCLDLEEEVIANNSTWVKNVGDLIALMMESAMCTDEEMDRRFGGAENFRPKSQMFVTADGRLFELVKR